MNPTKDGRTEKIEQEKPRNGVKCTQGSFRLDSERLTTSEAVSLRNGRRSAKGRLNKWKLCHLGASKGGEDSRTFQLQFFMCYVGIIKKRNTL